MSTYLVANPAGLQAKQKRMGLVIKIEKDKFGLPIALATDLTSFVEKHFEEQNTINLIPRAGKLIEVLRILMRHDVPYVLDQFKEES